MPPSWNGLLAEAETITAAFLQPHLINWHGCTLQSTGTVLIKPGKSYIPACNSGEVLTVTL